MFKMLEFVETMFMIFNNYTHRISMLHVYHHASMFVVAWMAVKFVPGGSGEFGIYDLTQITENSASSDPFSTISSCFPSYAQLLPSCVHLRRS